MHALQGLCDRLVARLVPQVKASAMGCYWQWDDKPQQCYKRWCCEYINGTRCNGWVRC
ncbi:hypothetical protein [Nonomuraea deserti]|uniref:hypothetical protein n=1 Tax=Nonomuraea deserti TaxID=1848322 RepID=UPI001405336A|nr:hypothetical protein [Nonomuraea deserti]